MMNFEAGSTGDDSRKREMVEQRGHALKQFSTRLSKTANIVAR